MVDSRAWFTDSLLCWGLEGRKGLHRPLASWGFMGCTGRHLSISSRWLLVQDALLHFRTKSAACSSKFLEKNLSCISCSLTLLLLNANDLQPLGFCCCPFSFLAWLSAHDFCCGVTLPVADLQLSKLWGKRNKGGSRIPARPFLCALVLSLSWVPIWPHDVMGLLPRNHLPKTQMGRLGSPFLWVIPSIYQKYIQSILIISKLHICELAHVLRFIFNSQINIPALAPSFVDMCRVVKN